MRFNFKIGSRNFGSRRNRDFETGLPTYDCIIFYVSMPWPGLWMEIWRILLRARYLWSLRYNHQWLMNIYMRLYWCMPLTCNKTSHCLWLRSKCITLNKLLLHQMEIAGSFIETASEIYVNVRVQCILYTGVQHTVKKTQSHTYIIFAQYKKFAGMSESGLPLQSTKLDLIKKWNWWNHNMYAFYVFLVAT